MRIRPFKAPAHPFRGPVLPPKFRWTARLVVILPLLIFLFASAAYLVRLWGILSANIPIILATEIQSQIKHEISIGRVVYSTPGVLTVENLKVSSGPTFAKSNGEPLVSANRVTIYYNWRELISDHNNAVHSLGDIVLDHPYLLVERFRNKRFNFSDILEAKRKNKTKPFVGRIIVHRGTLRFRDYLAVLPNPAVNELHRAEAVIDCRSEDYVYFNGTGSGSTNHFASISVEGNAWRKVSKQYRARVTASNLDAAYWVSYLHLVPQARVLGGRGNLSLMVSNFGTANPPSDNAVARPPAKPALPPDIVGQIAVGGGSIMVLDTRIIRSAARNVSGLISFTGTGATINMNGVVNGQPIAAHGAVYNFQHPQVAFTVSSPQLNVYRAAETLPALSIPPGLSIAPGPVTALLTGDAVKPTIIVDASFPSASYMGNRATGIRGHAIVANKVTTVPDASFDLSGGHVILRATVNSTGNRPIYNFGGRASRIDLATLRMPGASSQRYPLQGSADAAFVGDNQSGPFKVISNVTVANPRVGRTTFQAAHGRITYTQGQQVILNRVLLADSHGLATISGSVGLSGPHAPVNLAVNASSMDLHKIIGSYTNANIGGIGYFEGTVTGALDSPVASGSIHLFQGHYGRYATDAINGTMTASRNMVHFENVYVRRYPTQAHITGTISQVASRDPLFGLNVTFQKGDLQDFLSLLSPATQQHAANLLPSHQAARDLVKTLPYITGTAAGSFQITGHYLKPNVVGKVVVTDATMGAYRVQDARADIAFHDNKVKIDKAVIRSGTATVTGNAQWSVASGAVRAIFAGTDVELQRFRRYTDPYAALLGSIDFSGSLSGTLTNPEATFGLVGKNLSVNGQKLALFTGFGKYQDGELSSTGDPWEFHFQGPLPGMPNPTEGVSYVVDSFQFKIPNPGNSQGSLKLTAHIPEDTPEKLTHLVESLRDSRFVTTAAGQNFLANIDSLPRPLDATISIPTITVSGPLNDLAARGKLQIDGATVGNYHVTELGATIDYIPGKVPGGHLNLDAGGISIAGVPITSATATVDYINNIVSVPKLHMQSDRAFVDASGTADLNGKIDASLDASNVPLALFNSLMPNSRILGGEVSALSISASGLTRSPDLVASVSVEHPSMSKAPVTAADKNASNASAVQDASQFAYSLDEIRSSVITVTSATPDGPKMLTVNDLTAYKNSSPVVSLSGSIPFRWKWVKPTLADLPANLPLHAALTVKDISALAFVAPGLDVKRTGGSLVATYDVNPTQKTAGMPGRIVVTNASVGVVGIDTALDQINAAIGFNLDQAKIESFEGHSKKGGTFRIAGSGDLKNSPTLDLSLALKAFRIEESNRQDWLSKTYNSAVRGRIDGSILVTGALRTPRIATPLGSPVVISDANMVIPSASAAPGQPVAMLPIDPSFDLHVLLGARGKTISVGSSLLHADVNGSMTLGGSISDPRLVAEMAVYRGQFILPPSTFLKIVPPVGTVNMTLIHNPNPVAGSELTLVTTVDLYAQARVTISPSSLLSGSSVAGSSTGGPTTRPVSTSNSLLGGGQPQRYTITAHIHGILGDPKLPIDYSSSPGGLSQDQMVSALLPTGVFNGLFGGNAQDALRQQLTSSLFSVGVPLLLNPFENSVEQTFNLSSFSVDYSSPDLPVLVSIGKKIGHRLELYFTRSFGSRAPGAVNDVTQPPQYTLKLGYDLTNRLQLGISTDDQQNRTLSLEGVFGF